MTDNIVQAPTFRRDNCARFGGQCAMTRSSAKLPPDTRELYEVAMPNIGMDGLDEIVRSILALAASYKPGTIIKAERVVDDYLDGFEGYRARRAAMDALLHELALPGYRSRNRGGLFELI